MLRRLAIQAVRVAQKAVGRGAHLRLADGLSPIGQRPWVVARNFRDIDLPCHDPDYGEAVGIKSDLSKLFKHPLKHLDYNCPFKSFFSRLRYRLRRSVQLIHLSCSDSIVCHKLLMLKNRISNLSQFLRKTAPNIAKLHPLLRIDRERVPASKMPELFLYKVFD